MTACHIVYDPIQGHGEGHGGLKCVKMSDVIVYLQQLHVIKRPTVNYDTPRQ